ncbi:uncharacterized protein [Gossypium hirsutum]|uniref:Uncharacterized protein n=1 Tax=Gossypium hirsutum TaxID=3635 RepID=A0ABM2ZNW0_GOSHI|nr:uncharacterized protein LOC121214438 [Gossypium hirsutum]
MVTEAVSGNEAENRQSFNNAVYADGSFFGPGTISLRKIQQFPKHDTVKLGERNFLLWKQQVLLILEGYGLHEFALGTVSILPQSLLMQKKCSLIVKLDNKSFSRMCLFRLILFNSVEILMTPSVKVIGVLELLTEAMEGFLEVEVEEGSSVILKPNVNYVNELVMLSRSVIIILMKILKDLNVVLI